jgi:hypothetical protein
MHDVILIFHAKTPSNMIDGVRIWLYKISTEMTLIKNINQIMELYLLYYIKPDR